MANVGWLSNSIHTSLKPKESLIDVIKKNMSGYRDARDRSQVHASDITKQDFCPRQWSLQDLQKVKPAPQYIPTALATTFSLGSAIARLLIEEWTGDAAVGNWKCIRCDSMRTMCTKPDGWCNHGGKHRWEYQEVVFEAPEYAVSGSIDALFNLGTPFWRVTELKIMAPTEFDKIVAPLSEHRIRTSLYLKLVDESSSVWKHHFNLQTGTVLYVSRGYGKQNAVHNEILPLKEYEIKRDDEVVKLPLAKAKSLKMFREGKGIPTGICSTAVDAPAKKCNVCTACFSGKYPASINFMDLVAK